LHHPSNLPDSLIINDDKSGRYWETYGKQFITNKDINDRASYTFPCLMTVAAV